MQRRYIVPYQIKLYEALRQMNDQKVKFLVTVDDENKVRGTLTDGDVRRGILRGVKLEDFIEDIICKEFISVSDKDDLFQVLEAFQDPKIEFLPVIGESGQLKNMITRRGLQVLLLTNKEFSINYDFE